MTRLSNSRRFLLAVCSVALAATVALAVFVPSARLTFQRTKAPTALIGPPTTTIIRPEGR